MTIENVNFSGFSPFFARYSFSFIQSRIICMVDCFAFFTHIGHASFMLLHCVVLCSLVCIQFYVVFSSSFNYYGFLFFSFYIYFLFFRHRLLLLEFVCFLWLSVFLCSFASSWSISHSFSRARSLLEAFSFLKIPRIFKNGAINLVAIIHYFLYSKSVFDEFTNIFMKLPAALKCWLSF